jgi:hypothetical protein
MIISKNKDEFSLIIKMMDFIDLRKKKQLGLKVNSIDRLLLNYFCILNIILIIIIITFHKSIYN